jgi:hypothetical protein
MTAAELLILVRPFGPNVEDGELVFATDPPADLTSLLSILHTGVRSLLAGRQWWAHIERGKAGRFTRVELKVIDPANPIPSGVVLLSVKGDRIWDRLRADAHIDHPELFETELKTAGKK